ncbi:MAG: ABC transporter substrate-binding protein [Humidesulfovibrio sp.]|nr:ABC transporter substrate-binding protein [Humidesulfovibrio sp.]
MSVARVSVFVLALPAILALSAILVLSGVLDLSGVSGCSRGPEPLRIGAVLSVTGPAAYLGEPEKNTLLMLQEELNASGGVDGHKVEIVLYDDASDVATAIQAATRLIEEDRVAVVIGPSTSGNTLAVRQLFAPARIPLVSCAASERIVRPVDPWVFNTAPLDRDAVGKILADARRRGFTRLAAISVIDGFGQGGRAVLRELIRAQGLALVADETYGPADTDVSAQLGRIRDAGPDAVICWGTSPGAAAVARERFRLGLAAPLYMSHAVASPKFLEQAGEAAEGVILPAGRLAVADQAQVGGHWKALLGGYVERYVRKYGAPPSTFGGHAYDAFMLVASAVHAGRSVEPQAIRDNLERIKGLAGASGTFTMSPEDHNGLDQGAFLMTAVEQGRLKVLD